MAFPVGTGIYRGTMCVFLTVRRVPCGYRDIPITFYNVATDKLRSLWVQGYTDK